MKDLTIEAKDYKVHQDYLVKRAKRAERERKKEMEEAKKMRSERIRARVREKSRRAKEMEENNVLLVMSAPNVAPLRLRGGGDDVMMQSSRGGWEVPRGGLRGGGDSLLWATKENQNSHISEHQDKSHHYDRGNRQQTADNTYKTTNHYKHYLSDKSGYQRSFDQADHVSSWMNLSEEDYRGCYRHNEQTDFVRRRRHSGGDIENWTISSKYTC